uniref:hypothetical protein n=1 Tax=Exiguobacterium sp. KJ 601 TaxID=2782569 RepID=UPI0022AEFC51
VKAGYGAYTGYQTAKSRGYTGWKKWGYTAYSALNSAVRFGRAYKYEKALYLAKKSRNKPVQNVIPLSSKISRDSKGRLISIRHMTLKVC